VNALTQLNHLLAEIKASTEARRHTADFSDEEGHAFSTLVYLMEECARRRAQTRFVTTRIHLLMDLLFFVRDYHQRWIVKTRRPQEVYV
jgi:hypothetical protein